MKKIGFDLMGSDAGPQVIIKGIEKHISKNPNAAKHIIVYLTKEVEQLARTTLSTIPQENFVLCENFITPDDSEMVIRSKPDATFVRGVQDLSKSKIETIISTCNTKAFVATSAVLLKKISIESKVAIASFLPRSDGKDFFILDVGARVNYVAADFISLAKYGIEIMKSMRGISEPTIRLINVGSESGKGDALHIEADKILKKEYPNNYMGNMDPYSMMTHENDIILTDGFSGNIMSKAFEGGVELISSEISKVARLNLKNKIAAQTLKKDLKKVLFRYDYRSRGAAYLFGFDKLVLKAHGRSDEVAVDNALLTARQLIDQNVVSNLTKAIRGS